MNEVTQRKWGEREGGRGGERERGERGKGRGVKFRCMDSLGVFMNVGREQGSESGQGV